MSATYRFVGDAAELFPAWSGTITVAGVVRDPDAKGYVAPYQEGYQQPGELRPGQEFTGPEDLLGEVGHHRVERLTSTGEWAPTVQVETPGAEPEPAPPEPPAPVMAARTAEGADEPHAGFGTQES